MTTRERLIAYIDLFRERSGMSRSQFGTVCMGDPNFYFELINGRNPNSATIDRIEAFIDEYPLNNNSEPETAS